MESEGSEGKVILEMILPLVPVLFGALIGVLGSLAITIHTHKLSVKQNRVQDKIKKLEELVSNVYEVEIYLKNLENLGRQYGCSREEEVLVQAPISKIEAFQVLYFPELEESVQLLREKLHCYRKFVLLKAESKGFLGYEISDSERKKLDQTITAIYKVVSEAKKISDTLHAS